VQYTASGALVLSHFISFYLINLIICTVQPLSQGRIKGQDQGERYQEINQIFQALSK
jgi:hypothetical protein